MAVTKQRIAFFHGGDGACPYLGLFSKHILLANELRDADVLQRLGHRLLDAGYHDDNLAFMHLLDKPLQYVHANRVRIVDSF